MDFSQARSVSGLCPSNGDDPYNKVKSLLRSRGLLTEDEVQRVCDLHSRGMAARDGLSQNALEGGLRGRQLNGGMGMDALHRVSPAGERGMLGGIGELQLDRLSPVTNSADHTEKLHRKFPGLGRITGV
jgi:hypothetical protein